MNAALETPPRIEVDLPASKPAFLRRVRIRGYKSIEFCDVTLEPFTILVGRNASGKSNFLDALAFLADLMSGSISQAVKRHQSWHAIRCRTNLADRIEIAASGEFTSFSNSIWSFDYSIVVGGGEKDEPRIESETVRLINRLDARERRGFDRVQGQPIQWFGNMGFHEDNTELTKLLNKFPSFGGAVEDSESLLVRIRIGSFTHLAEYLRSFGVYNFSPPAIRMLQAKTYSQKLQPDGVNLPAVIKLLQETEPDSIERIRQFISVIVPGVAGFRVQRYGDDYETVRFIIHAPPSARQEFDASGMSDGTLRVLASLVAVHQILTPVGYPALIGIEEPETSLHPGAMRALVDAFDEATLRTQILISTHSAELLDNPKIQPENLRIVEMIDGRTVVGPLDAMNVELIRENLETLGHLERHGLLSVDLDDLERQRKIAQDVSS